MGINLPTKWENRDKFPGMVSYMDPEKVPVGSAVAGYNVSFNRGDMITNRPLGYSTYPSSSSVNSSTSPITSNHTFRRRDGSNIMMRSHTTVLEYYDETSSAWTTIQGSYTTGKKFGFTDYNINTDQHSYVYFGNGVEYLSRWAGNITNLTVALTNGTSTLTVASTTGFSASGNVTIGGTVTAYTSLTGSTVINLTAPWGGSTIASGTAITESVTTYSSGPIGNILTNYNNRIFVAGITATPQAVYFSKYGDATDWSGAALITASTATSAGIFNLAEGGGGVIGFTRDEQSFYIVKSSIIYNVTLSDTLYSLEPLKPYDGKSHTTGGIATWAIFATGNGSVLITPDKKILHLTRVQLIDYPQLDPISDTIFPTVNALFFENAAGITFEEKIYIACSTESSSANDTVLVYNLRSKLWETPITGWNVTDWLIYNNGTGDRLFFSSNNSKNIFEVTATPQDGDFDVSSSVLLNQEVFGDPAQQKYINNFFCEGHIAPNTDPLTISLYFNDGGFSQILRATVSGTDSDILFSTNAVNVFGFNPFGIEMFGSNADQSGKKKFRVYTKNTLRNIPFYNIQLGLSSDGSNQAWDVINYAWDVGVYQNPENRNLYIGFS